MFADAVELAAKFTRPVVVIYKCVDGECRSGVGSFVVVNSDGWIVSAAHLSKMADDILAASNATKTHIAAIEAIHANHSLPKGARKTALRKLGDPKPEAPLAYAIWWSWDRVKIVDVKLLQHADLLIGRLEPFDPTWIASYPSFRDPTGLIRQGTSLCRYGYPFPSVKATYDPATTSFTFAELSLAGFPNEGILTRDIPVSSNPAGYRNRFIETSSPGLKGQSGGPLVDTKGVVWGIQSQTRNLSLGFDPEVPDEHGKGTNRKEHQFLNVGWASHPESVAGFLRECGVAHTLAPV